MTTDETRQRLLAVQADLAKLTAEQQRLEGQRDTLLRELTDHAGCHDQRHTLR